MGRAAEPRCAPARPGGRGRARGEPIPPCRGGGGGGSSRGRREGAELRGGGGGGSRAVPSPGYILTLSWMFWLVSSSAFFSREDTQSLRFWRQREAAARFRSRNRCRRSSGSSSAARRRRPPVLGVGWAGDTWQGTGDRGQPQRRLGDRQGTAVTPAAGQGSVPQPPRGAVAAWGSSESQTLSRQFALKNNFPLKTFSQTSSWRQPSTWGFVELCMSRFY